MRHIILISGKDSLATALVQLEREPNLPYELVHNEVGWDLPETLEWIDRVGEFFGREIIRCGDDLTEICREQKVLPTPWRRYCTKYAKIKPLNDMLGSAPATVYFGLRADEPDRVGYVVPRNQPLTPRYPLREAGVGLHGVWKLCAGADLLPPSFRWEWIESRVRALLMDQERLLDDLDPWQRNPLLAWRSRSNCDRCFYARLYEKVGLYEHHPDRFEAACQLEEELSHGDEFSWSSGYRLRDLVGRADAIKERRAQWVAKTLLSKRQLDLFEEDEPLPDDLAVTSCGLLCGK